jgi:VCBS repeat-containing protein
MSPHARCSQNPKDIRFLSQNLGRALKIDRTAQPRLAAQNGDDIMAFIPGTSGNDNLFGTAAADDLRGQGGNDLLVGGDGNDYMEGNAGNDSLFGGNGDDNMRGNEGDDVIAGADGNDYAAGGSGNDSIFGESGHDNLQGEAGNDLIAGGFGDDYISGSDGDDLMYGEDGADLIEGGRGNDLAYGGNGSDYISDDPLGPWGLGGGNDTYFGGAGHDIVAGGAGHDSLSGGLDNDLVFGGAGSDIVDGGDGDDFIMGGNASGNSPAPLTLWANDGHANLFRIDVNAAGEGTKVLVGNTGTVMVDIAMGADGRLFGVSGNSLFSINTTNGASTFVGHMGNGVNGAALSFGADGLLYNSNGSTIFRFNPNTPSHTTAFWTNPAGGIPAGDFLTVGDKIFVSWLTPAGATQLLQLDLNAAGAVASSTVLGHLPNETFGLALGPDGSIYATTGNTIFKLAVPNAPISGIIPSTAVSGSAISGVYFGATSNTETSLLTGLDLGDHLSGGAGNDTIFGMDGNDSIFGGDGADRLQGDAGNDHILYGRGHDTVFGGDGDDLIDDAPGFDATHDRSLVFGGAGQDTIFGTASHDTLFGGAGNDLINDESGDDVVFGDFGNDSLHGGAGNDLLDGGQGADLIYGGAGNDTLDGGGNPDGEIDTIFGGAGDDSILPGAGGADLLYGGDGRDTLSGGLDADALHGDAGDDVLYADQATGGTSLEGADSLYGGDGNDTLILNANANLRGGLALGGNGNDTAFGSGQGDVIDGGQGADLIYGGAGNDTLDGGGNPDGESDTIFGGAGDDSILPGAGGADLLYGGDGRDTLSGGLDADALHGDAGDDVLYADQATGGTSLEGADSLYGGDGNDTLILNANANLRGGLALGGNGNDTAFGSAQGDVIDGGQGADLIYGGAGNDTLDGGGNPDGEIDTIFGGAGDDSILPGAGGADLLYGGDGRDTLSGGLDADALHGDAGDDVLYADQATGGTSLEGADSLYGGDGNDTLILNANANLRGGLALGGNGNDTAFGSGQGDVIDGGQGADLIYGGAGNDTLDGGGNPDGEIDTIFGGAGDDSILPGAGGADLLYGGDGRDTLSGGLDADALHGDAGDDVLYADQATGGTSLEGADSLYGGDGNDTLILNANANLRGGLALGGNGNDTAFGSGQGDVIDGGAGNDQLFGGAGDDIIRGFDGFGSDIAIGGESGEVAGDLVDLTSMTTATVLTFTGSEAGTITSAGAAMTFSEFEQVNLGSGDDIVIGDVGDNVANAGAGNDSLNGGAGSDTLGGGEGDDLFTQTLAQNAGANDRFDGGAGSDELHLDVTAAEWANPLFQTDVAAFLAHIASGSPAPFSFASTGLTVTSIERFTINIDGVPTDPVNASVTAAAQTVAAGEDGAAVAVNLLANAIVDDRAGSVQVLGTSAFGTVSVVTDLLATPQTAVLIFTPNAATQALRDGEVVTEVLSYSITDVDGSTATSSVTITLTGANDTATITGLSVGGLEESALSPVSGTLTVADVDTGEAVLQTPANLVGVYGTFTVDTASGAWSYTPNTGSPALESLAAGTQVTDQITVASLDGTASQTITITITGTNDAPTLAAGVLASVEDGPSVTLDLTALGDDIDAGEDGASLLYSLTTPPSVGTASVANGVLTYSVGTAFQSLAQGDEETVTLTVTATDAFGAQASNTVTITITGTNDAPTVAASLTAAATEDGSAVSLNLLAGAADVDNGAVLSVANVTGLVAGVTLSGATLSVDPSNAAFQSLALGQTRVITVSYDVTDETGASVPQTATITVTGTNDAPTVAASLTAAATEDGSAVSLNLLAGAADVDNGAVLSVANVTGLVAGVTLSGATLSIDPSNAAFQSLALGQTRVITVNYDVTDETGAAVPQTATITVTGTNDAPTVAASLTAAATEDGSAVSLNLLAGAADVDNGAVLSVANVTGLVAGVTLSGATLSIDPSNAAFQSLALGQTRVITVSYDVTDEAGASVPQTATITVTGTNDAPTVAASLTAAATEDASAVSLNLLAGAADVDTGAVLSVANVTGLVAGVTLSGATLSVDPSNAAFQSLALGQTRVITVSYDVTDEAGASVAQTATITVTGTNDTPTVAASLTAAATEDASPVSLNLLAGAADVDNGAVLSVANVTGLVAGVTLSGANLSVDPSNAAFQSLALGQTRVITVSYDVTDETGASAPQTATITVTGTNDAPTVAASLTAAATEDGSAVSLNLLAGAADVDNGAVLSVANVTGLVAGVTLSGATLSVDPSNAAFQSLALGQTRVITVSYDVTDEAGAAVAQTATITVTGTNDAPTVAAGVLASVEDGPSVTLDLTALGDDIDADEDGASLIYTLTTPPSVGTASIANGVLTYSVGTAFQSLAQGDEETVTLTVTATDAFGAQASNTVTITVTGTNDGPVFTAGLNTPPTVGQNPQGEAELSGTINFADIDLADTHTVTAVSASGNPVTAVIGSAATGGAIGVLSWVYTVDPQIPVGAQDTIVISLTDGNLGGTIEATLVVDLPTGDGAPDVSAPMRVFSTIGTGELPEDVNLYFTDPNLDPLTAAADPSQNYKGLEFNGSAQIVFNPDNDAYQFLTDGAQFTAFFTFLLSDGTTVQTAQIEWTITGTRTGLTGTDDADDLVADLFTSTLINGGAGDDTMSGGFLDDVFAYFAAGDGFDLITNFEVGQDKIGVSAATFGGNLQAGVDPTVLVTTDAMLLDSGSTDGVFIVVDNGRSSTLYWDADGGLGDNAVAIAQLDGVSSLTSDDFFIFV